MKVLPINTILVMSGKGLQVLPCLRQKKQSKVFIKFKISNHILTTEIY